MFNLGDEVQFIYTMQIEPIDDLAQFKARGIVEDIKDYALYVRVFAEEQRMKKSDQDWSEWVNIFGVDYITRVDLDDDTQVTLLEPLKNDPSHYKKTLFELVGGNDE